MAKVYVTQKPPTSRQGGQVSYHIDISPATMFGELVYLAHRGEVEHGNERQLLWAFRERLKQYDAEVDYLLPIGSTITMVMAAIVAAEKSSGIVRVLQWDKRLRGYEVFNIDLHDQPL